MMIQFYADLSYSYFDTLIHTLIDFSYFFSLAAAEAPTAAAAAGGWL